MLVLSRKESERIRIGESIVVTIVRIARDRVRVGIEAPDDVLVLRDELEREPREAEASISPPKAAATRSPVERRTLADFRRSRLSPRPATDDSPEPDEEARRNVALAEDEETDSEDRGASPMRRFFRW